MTARALRQMIALLLAVTVTAMGFAAASARGQTVVGGQVVVLCSDGGLVQVTLDADGNPTGGSHLCPDLAAALLAAHALALPEVSRPETLATRVTALQPRLLASHPVPHALARGPPVSA